MSDDTPAAIPAPPGYKPVFHDTNGLTAAEYRTKQHKKRTAGSADEIVALYRELGSWNAVADHLGTTTYHVRKAVRQHHQQEKP